MLPLLVCVPNKQAGGRGRGRQRRGEKGYCARAVGAGAAARAGEGSFWGPHKLYGKRVAAIDGEGHPGPCP